MLDWPQIVRQHGPTVWKAARRLLSNAADAEDCFQNTFMAAWELSRRQAVRNWPGLLKQLATRRALELLRRRVRDSSRITTMDLNAQVDRKVDQPDAVAEANELAERLRLALAGLEVQQAEVFCLARIENMSYEEISERLGLSVNHVGVLLNRARTALRQHVHDEDPAAAEETTGEAKS